MPTEREMRTNDIVSVLGRFDTGRIIAIDSTETLVYVEFRDGREWHQPYEITTVRDSSTPSRKMDRTITEMFGGSEDEDE